MKIKKNRITILCMLKVSITIEANSQQIPIDHEALEYLTP